MAVELQQIKKTRAFKNICITITVNSHNQLQQKGTKLHHIKEIKENTVCRGT